MPTPVIWELSDRKRLLFLILIMIAISAFVALGSGWLLYRAALNKQQEWLLEIVQSKARLIGAVAAFDAQGGHGDHPEEAFQATMSQVIESGIGVEGFGETGEFVIGLRRGDRIAFLLPQRLGGRKPPPPIPFDSDLAEPMRLALAGNTGKVVARDYRNATVVAAHTPIPEMGVGLVAKIDLDELKAPLIKAEWVSGASVLVIIVLGVGLSLLMTRPIIAHLETANASLNEAQKLAHLGNWRWDIATGKEAWSDEQFRVFGYEPNEIAPTYDAFVKSVHPDDLETVKQAVQRAFDGAAPYSCAFRIVRPNGEERWIHSQGEVHRSIHGEPKTMVGTVLDITESKRAEMEILRLKERQELILSSAGDGICGLDTAGNTTFANPAAERLLGWTSSELIGMNQHTLFHHTKPDGTPYPVDECPIYTAYRENKVRHVEDDVFWRKDGSPFPVEYVSTPIVEDGDIKGAVLVFRDITERKQAEMALAAKTAELERSNEELTHFSHIISHDLQEPLHVVTGFLNLLEADYKDKLDDAAEEFIHFAVDGTVRMSKMIKALLEYARVQSQGKPLEPVSLKDVFEQALLNLHAAVSTSGATVSVTEDLPKVMGDELQLVRVAQNLIGNGIKYQDASRSPDVRVSVERSDVEWVISVKDNGIGVDPKDFNRIFDVFQRLHTREEFEGTGIGLAVVKRTIERHGGRVWVESEQGGGSVFSFSLPVSTPS